MVEAALVNSVPGGPAPESESALFHRRIEFHAARKPFNGFGSNSNNGFSLVTLNPNTEPLKAAGSGKKSEKLELSETGLDPELTFQITYRRIGAGLRNLGNTCFLNSVLQCLTYTEPLAAYLQSGKHQNSCHTSGFCALCAIQKHVSRALQSTGRILEPKDLVSNLRCISRNFRNARQEDAHEYMVNLLESMHKCCLPSGVPSESPSAYEKSLVHRIFGGRLRSQVKCMQCSFCSNKFDPFLDLSLEIINADSLHKALAHFMAKEQLDGGAKVYQCQQCKQKVRALKQLTIHKAPHVLTVHLKRFSSHAPGQKIDRKVAFEPTLDLKPYVTGPYDGDLKYTLYGVLVHAGWSTHSGHYYCFVRTSSGMWYSLDDNQVIQVNERKVLEQKAYMLFYVRDRRNICTKKPVGIVQKENVVMSTIGTAAYSKINLELKEKIQNGSTEKKIDGPFSVALSQKDSMVSTASKETPSKKLSFQNVNGTNAVDNSVVPPMKDPVKDHPSTNDGPVAQGGDLRSTVDTLSLGATAKSDASNSSFSVQDQNASVVMLSNGKLPQQSLHKKESSDPVVMLSTCNKNCAKENPIESVELPSNSRVPCMSPGDACKLDGTNSEMCNSKIIPIGPIAEASNEADHMKSSKQNGIGEGQVGGSCMVTGDSAGKSIHENGQRMVGVPSKLIMDPPATTEHLSYTKNKMSELKVKRKLFKYQVATMSLSSSILFGGGLCMRKKKHKQRKLISLQKKFPNQHLLGVNDLPSSLGQPVSDKSLTQPVDPNAYTPKKKEKCDSDGTNQYLSIQSISGNGSASSDVIHNEFKERVVFDGTTLSGEKQPQIRQSVAQGAGLPEDYQRESRQSCAMSMLTSGVEETTVARWDGIGVSLSEKSETRAEGTSQIGYIGDEWDEDYDRGKRKKIRGPKITFGGPNLFQEFAARNSKRKRAKLDRFSSRNHPVRI
ncbi:Ubiquitin carboxyl-terminal hydrolase [Handroanthus impetiginosus]|uniref:Ubiquitin carboxyl-terminal hydrolase n=1 Tax=Handroanthus impetiginosus TaxID=429701 RepID=A0A2G9HLV0_9LAMI|nr:Ubiquitin carboxyl-terminal hydrolase [Handroanthus impetiginosus]